MDEGLNPADEGLERELIERGPRMLRQELIENRPPDGEFVRALRRRLAGESEPVRARRPWRPAWRGWIVWAGAATAALVLALLLIRPHGREEIHTEAFLPPTPTRGDIIRGYPALVGLGGGGFSPSCTAPTEHEPPRAYPRPLRLIARTFLTSPRRLPAYRLAGPAFDVPRVQSIARLLGIRGTMQTIRFRGEPSRCVGEAIQRGGPMPLFRRVMVSIRTGEPQYTDMSHQPISQAPVNASGNVAAAERWLHRLGWPSLPVHRPQGPEAQMRRTVLLDWNGVVAANVPAATLVLDARGQVFDAELWPPVTASTSVSVRSYKATLARVTAGTIPIGVEPPPEHLVPGSGRVASMGHTEVLTVTETGAYLTPAYRFSGPVHLGKSSYRWSALVPAG